MRDSEPQSRPKNTLASQYQGALVTSHRVLLLVTVRDAELNLEIELGLGVPQPYRRDIMIRGFSIIPFIMLLFHQQNPGLRD